MPIGLTSAQPLSAGLSPISPVTPEQPVITPDAVSQLVDSFRKGSITGADLADHIGIMAAQKNRAIGEELREYVSPEAIQARQSALGSQTAQNNLVSAQAQAAQGLVTPQANLQQQQIGAQTANVVQGPIGLQAIQQYGPMFGETMDDFRNTDGSMDFQAAAKRGNQMGAQMNLANMWIDRLTPVADRTITDASGAKHTAKVNKFGIDVTPPMPELGYQGSPAYWSYVKELNDYLPDFHPARAQFMMNQPKGAGQAAPPGLVSPSTAAPITPPTIEPAQGFGITTEAAKGSYQTPAEIRKSMVEEPAIKTLQEQQKYANNFRTVADTMEQTGATQPGAKVPPQNANDIGLAESIVKLYDPQAAIREFKWDKLEEAQPWLEKIGAWKQLALKEGSFTPESRQRLIKMGDDVINGLEASARPRLALSQQNATDSANLAGQNPQSWIDQTLTTDEKRILAGQPFRTPKTYQATSAAPNGTIPVKTGPYAGWIYNPATGKVTKP
jgi:hypothetical protein